MFYAIDKNTNEIILSLNIRDRNYKDTYNKGLRFRCAGSCENGKDCDDENVVFINSKTYQFHFRHSSGSKCSAHKAFIEFNNTFYSNWFKLFKYEYRKPYWYNCKLEQIRDDNNVIIIRYTQQTSEVIKKVENYTQNKIIWILSLENRKYSKIAHYKGKIYVDFIGNKNDIPLYDNNKSVVYLDTETDILLKVHLNSTSSLHGQEIECMNIYDVCNEYDFLFTAYPYRQKDTFFRSLIKQQEEYKNDQEIKRKANEKEQIYLLSEYNKANNEYITNKTLENFYKMTTIYNRFSIPKPVKQNEEYLEYTHQLIYDIEDIKCVIPIISKKNEELKSEYNRIIKLQKISKLKDEYTRLFKIIENMKLKYTDITYIERLVYPRIFDLDLMVYNYRQYINIDTIQKLIEEEEKQKLIDEEKKQKLIEEGKKQKLIEEEKKQKLIEEKIKQKLIEEEKKQKLLDIIKDNYSKILMSSKQTKYLEYIKKYYTYITYPINHNLDKMILYIKRQEEYLQSI
jgi:hypothetical protein